MFRLCDQVLHGSQLRMDQIPRISNRYIVLLIILTAIIFLASELVTPNWLKPFQPVVNSLLAAAFTALTVLGLWRMAVETQQANQGTNGNPNRSIPSKVDSRHNVTLDHGNNASQSISTPAAITPEELRTVDLQKIIQSHLDWSPKSLNVGPSRSPGFTALITTEIRYTEETVLIRTEIRHTEQEVFAKEKEVQKPDYFQSSLDSAYQERIREANSVSLRILVWGPSESDSELYRKRVQIRNTLLLMGHDARFSEDWQPIGGLGSLTLLHQELIQAQLVDWIIILYASYGSIAETHDIGNFNELKMKLLVLVDQQHTGGYGSQGLLTNLKLYNRVYAYTPEELRTCSLVSRVKEEAYDRRNEKWENIQRARSSRVIS